MAFFPADDRTTLSHIVRMTSITYLLTLALSWRVYVPGYRLFLPVPFIDVLGSLPAAADWALLGVQVLGLLWLLISPLKRLPAYAVIAFTVICALKDMILFQPYLYMYCFTLFAATFHNRLDRALLALRIMVAGVYFWAGYQKINVTFMLSVFPWFVEPLHNFLGDNNPLNVPLVFAAFITPFFELMIGVLLCFPQWRRVATLMAFVMFVFVLGCLGPFGHNWNVIVYPWNAYLFLLELLLFYRPQPAGMLAMADIRRKAGQFLQSLVCDNPAGTACRYDYIGLLAVGLFVVTPALAMFGLWPPYLGFKLYSGNVMLAVASFPPDERFRRVPQDLKMLLKRNNPLLLQFWTYLESNTSPMPVEQVYRMGARGLCPYLDDPAGAKLILYSPPPFYSIISDHKDVPLCP